MLCAVATAAGSITLATAQGPIANLATNLAKAVLHPGENLENRPGHSVMPSVLGADKLSQDLWVYAPPPPPETTQWVGSFLQAAGPTIAARLSTAPNPLELLGSLGLGGEASENSAGPGVIVNNIPGQFQVPGLPAGLSADFNLSRLNLPNLPTAAKTPGTAPSTTLNLGGLNLPDLGNLRSLPLPDLSNLANMANLPGMPNMSSMGNFSLGLLQALPNLGDIRAPNQISPDSNDTTGTPSNGAGVNLGALLNLPILRDLANMTSMLPDLLSLLRDDDNDNTDKGDSTATAAGTTDASSPLAAVAAAASPAGTDGAATADATDTAATSSTTFALTGQGKAKDAPEPADPISSDTYKDLFAKPCPDDKRYTLVSALLERCDLITAEFITCEKMVEKGTLPKGTMSFKLPNKAVTGVYALPNGCSSAPISIEYERRLLTFSTTASVQALILHNDFKRADVFYYGSGVTYVSGSS